MSLTALLATPCLGALIGYVTNKIAILMLFRPHRPWVIRGWRVPFTPGIIPAKRHALATSIGNMVGGSLLTNEALGRAIAAEPFQNRLRSLFARQTDSFCTTDWPALTALFPPEQAGVRDSLHQALAKALTGWLHQELARPDAEARLARLLAQLGAHLDRDTLQSLVQRLLAQTLADSGEGLGRALTALFRQAGADGLRLCDLAPSDLTGRLHTLLRAQTPVLLDRLGDEVLSQENRPQLVRMLVALAYQLLGSLGPLGAIAQGFFESAAFARRVDRYLDQHETDIRIWLASPSLQKRLAEVLQESVDALLQKSVAETLDDWPPGELEALCLALGGRVAVILRGGTVSAQLARTLAMHLEALCRSMPEDGGAATLLAFWQGEAGQALLDEVVTGAVQALETVPLGRITGSLPKELRELAATHLTRQANRLLQSELPGLVQALQFRELVSEKVETLDLMQLERLLLSIMEEQFRYINFFGAVLGFLIGCLNLLVQGLGS